MAMLPANSLSRPPTLQAYFPRLIGISENTFTFSENLNCFVREWIAWRGAPGGEVGSAIIWFGGVFGGSPYCREEAFLTWSSTSSSSVHFCLIFGVLKNSKNDDIGNGIWRLQMMMGQDKTTWIRMISSYFVVSLSALTSREIGYLYSGSVKKCFFVPWITEKSFWMFASYQNRIEDNQVSLNVLCRMMLWKKEIVDTSFSWDWIQSRFLWCLKLYEIFPLPRLFIHNNLWEFFGVKSPLM